MHFEVDGGNWFLAVPPPTIHQPAADQPHDTLDGRPAALARTGLGILTDLRIFGTPYEHRGTLHIRIVSELDHWRGRLHPGAPVPGLSSPLDRVWIEHRLDLDDAPAVGTVGPYDVWQRLAPEPGTPGPRIPAPARDVRHLHGRRIIQVTPLGWAWNLRAVSDPYDHDGELTVNITSAEGYYRWLIDGRPPEAAPIPLYLLWAE